MGLDFPAQFGIDFRHGLLAEDELVWVLRKRSEQAVIGLETHPGEIQAEIESLQASGASNKAAL